MNVQVISVGDEFVAHLKVTQRWFICFLPDQSSSSTLTESSFLFDSCLIHRDTVMLVIEKGSVQTVAIQ